MLLYALVRETVSTKDVILSVTLSKLEMPLLFCLFPFVFCAVYFSLDYCKTAASVYCVVCIYAL